MRIQTHFVGQMIRGPLLIYLSSEKQENIRVGKVDSETRLPRFESQLHHLPALCPWEGHLASLRLSSFICKLVITLPTSQGYYKN